MTRRTRRTRKTRKARRAGPIHSHSHVHNFLPQRFRPALTRQNGKRNLTKRITIKGRNQRGYNLTGILNNPNFGPNNLSHMNSVVESRRGNPRRTPFVVPYVPLNPEESQKYAELYHNYTLNNSANPDENFLKAIFSSININTPTKKKLAKHFLGSLEAGSELNQNLSIVKIYNDINDYDY